MSRSSYDPLGQRGGMTVAAKAAVSELAAPQDLDGAQDELYKAAQQKLWQAEALCEVVGNQSIDAKDLARVAGHEQAAHAKLMHLIGIYLSRQDVKAGEAMGNGYEGAAAEQAEPEGQTLDQLADNTLTRVAAFIGECVSAESFCGLAVDEMRDEDGLLLSLRLVPCDKDAMGEAVRRVGK